MCFGASAPLLCLNQSMCLNKIQEIKLSTKDLLALASMKNAAKREM
jgi:hypothetical protein